MKEVNCMETKKFIVLLMAMVFTLGVVGLSFSAQEIKGTVSKIEGNKLTILDDMGKEKTVEVKDLKSLKEIRVGDRVLVKDGKVTKGDT
jgi:outer membrane lipoprotein SlyB